MDRSTLRSYTIRLRSAVPNAAMLLFAVGIVLRLMFLTSQSLWYDEGISLHRSGGRTVVETWSRILRMPTTERYQPLYFVFLYYWRMIFGHDDFCLRIASVFFGCGFLGFVYLTALAVYGRSHALWSLAIASVSSCCVFYSQEVRPYALILFLASVQTYACLRLQSPGEHTNRRSCLLLLALSTGVGCLCSLFLGLYGFSLLVAELIVQREIRRTVRHWILAGIGAVPVISYFFYIFIFGPKMPTMPIFRGSIIKNVLFVPYGLIVGTTYGPPLEQLRGPDQTAVMLTYWPRLLLLALTLALVAWTLSVAIWRERGKHEVEKASRFLQVVLCISFSLSFFLSLVTRMNWLPRHTIFLLVPLFLLLPVTVHQPQTNSLAPTVNFRLAKLALVSLILANVYSLGNYYLDERHARDDYRATAAYLREHRGESGKSVLLWGLPILLAHYGDTETLDGRKLNKNNLGQEIFNLTSGAEKVLVAINREFYFDPARSGLIERRMKAHYDLAGRVSFRYFTIYHFRRPPLTIPASRP